MKPDSIEHRAFGPCNRIRHTILRTITRTVILLGFAAAGWLVSTTLAGQHAWADHGSGTAGAACSALDVRGKSVSDGCHLAVGQSAKSIDVARAALRGNARALPGAMSDAMPAAAPRKRADHNLSRTIRDSRSGMQPHHVRSLSRLLDLQPLARTLDGRRLKLQAQEHRLPEFPATTARSLLQRSRQLAGAAIPAVERATRRLAVRDLSEKILAGRDPISASPELPLSIGDPLDLASGDSRVDNALRLPNNGDLSTFDESSHKFADPATPVSMKPQISVVRSAYDDRANSRTDRPGDLDTIGRQAPHQPSTLTGQNGPAEHRISSGQQVPPTARLTDTYLPDAQSAGGAVVSEYAFAVSSTASAEPVIAPD